MDNETPLCILLVDDSSDFVSNLTLTLKHAGFEVKVAGTGEQALKVMSESDLDLVILDVELPGISGREVLRRMRKATIMTPAIMLTVHGSPAERAQAINEGADDYINKPFEICELDARIRGLLRRSRAGLPSLAGAQVLQCGPLTLNRQARRVRLVEQDLVLTNKAISVLEYLMLHPGQVISREHLLEATWGWDHIVATRAVDTRIAELRHTLKDSAEAPRFIETVIGQGYRFIGQVEVKR